MPDKNDQQQPLNRQPAPMARGRTRPRGNKPGRRQKRNISRILWGVAVAGVSILFIAALILPSLAGVLNRNTPRDIAGPGERIPIMSDTRHVPSGTTVTYSTTPPTSGPHYDRVARPDFYSPDVQVPDEIIVHNLEHSEVIISYNFTDDARVEQLRRWVLDRVQYPCYVVARYYAKIPENTVALTAWGRLDGPFEVGESLSDADLERVAAFVNAYAGVQGVGPEWFPCTPAPRE